MGDLIDLMTGKTTSDETEPKNEKTDILKAILDGYNGYMERNGKAPIGFTLILWDEEYNIQTTWDTGKCFPGLMVPDFAKQACQLAFIEKEKGA